MILELQVWTCLEINFEVQYSSGCVLQFCSEQRLLQDFEARSRKSASKDLICCPVSLSVKICIISCHIHNFVLVCNLNFLKNSKGIPKSEPPNHIFIPKQFPNNSKRIFKEFPENSKRIPKKFPKNSKKFLQKISKKFSKNSQKFLPRAYRLKSFSSLFHQN